MCMKNSNIVIVTIVCAAIAGAGGFWGGTIYQKSQITTMMGNQMGGRGEGVSQLGRNGMNGNTSKTTNNNVPAMNGRGGGAISGEVTAKDDKSLTVKMTDGSSKIVIISDSTTYHLSAESDLNKIDVGTKVATFGTSNADGTLTANSIEINPVNKQVGTK